MSICINKKVPSTKDEECTMFCLANKLNVQFFSQKRTGQGFFIHLLYLFDVELTVYPNPSDGLFTLRVAAGEEHVGTYEGALFDLQGHMVASYRWTIDQPGPYTFRVGSRELTGGIYILAVRGVHIRWAERLVVKK